MILCICKNVSYSNVRLLVENGVTDFEGIKHHTGCSSKCGKCECSVREAVESCKRALHAESVELT